MLARTRWVADSHFCAECVVLRNQETQSKLTASCQSQHTTRVGDFPLPSEWPNCTGGSELAVTFATAAQSLLQSTRPRADIASRGNSAHPKAQTAERRPRASCGG